MCQSHAVLLHLTCTRYKNNELGAAYHRGLLRGLRAKLSWLALKYLCSQLFIHIPSWPLLSPRAVDNLPFINTLLTEAVSTGQDEVSSPVHADATLLLIRQLLHPECDNWAGQWQSLCRCFLLCLTALKSTSQHPHAVYTSQHDWYAERRSEQNYHLLDIARILGKKH